jgi:hypothetical protein
VFPTYGDIISTIKQEGLKMCIEHRIIKQLNDNKRKAKYETGNLCEQYEAMQISCALGPLVSLAMSLDVGIELWS